MILVKAVLTNMKAHLTEFWILSLKISDVEHFCLNVDVHKCLPCLLMCLYNICLQAIKLFKWMCLYNICLQAVKLFKWMNFEYLHPMKHMIYKYINILPPCVWDEINLVVLRNYLCVLCHIQDVSYSESHPIMKCFRKKKMFVQEIEMNYWGLRIY